jgi:hypothetical protein
MAIAFDYLMNRGILDLRQFDYFIWTEGFRYLLSLYGELHNISLRCHLDNSEFMTQSNFFFCWLLYKFYNDPYVKDLNIH